MSRLWEEVISEKEILGVITGPTSAHETVVRVVELKGQEKKFVDIRKRIKKDTKWTRKGIMLPIDEAKQLFEILKKLK